MIRENKIPLNLPYPEPSMESLEAIREAEEMIRSGSGENSGSGKGYATGRKLIETTPA